MPLAEAIAITECRMVLEGLCALKKISRTDNGRLHAPPATGARKRDPQREFDQIMNEEEAALKGKKKYYN